MDYRNVRPLYLKGTAKVLMFDPATDDVVYGSNKLQTAQIQTSINLSPIQGGLGNPTLINIPDTPNFTMSMTAADFSLEAQGLQVGSAPAYNGIVKVSESVTCAAGGVLTVSGTPVMPLGSATGEIVGIVNGTAYPFAGKTITLSTYTESNSYCVEYWVQKVQSKQITISTLFAPTIVRALIEAPLFSSASADVSTGSRVGTAYITVPRLQLNGDLNIDMSQTTAATTVLNATALSFDEYQATTGNACAADEPKLAYISIDLYDDDTYGHVTQLVVVGGGISGETDDEVANPVLLLMDNGQTVAIQDYADFVFTPASNVGTVDATTGVITIGTASGDIAVAAASGLNRPDLTAVINVEVS